MNPPVILIQVKLLNMSFSEASRKAPETGTWAIMGAFAGLYVGVLDTLPGGTCKEYAVLVFEN